MAGLGKVVCLMARMDGKIRTTSPRAPGGAVVGTGEVHGAVVRDDLAKRGKKKQVGSETHISRIIYRNVYHTTKQW